MGRPVMLSNNSMVVGLNEQGLVHDFYYPYVGQENLTTARSVHHKIGVWVDGQFSWLDSAEWKINVNFEDSALISNIVAEHSSLALKLNFSDFVDCQFNAFCRSIEVTNLASTPRDIRLFFHQVFQISSEGRADTALFVPRGSYIFDYKGHCSLLIYACDGSGQPFDQFAVGNYAIEGKAGTYVDAEDGELSGNLVEHGGVDSVIRCRLNIPANRTESINYWVIADDSQTDAEKTHNILLSSFLKRKEATRAHWQNWLAIADKKASIPQPNKAIFNKSLMIIKAHIDKRGGIIASCDSSIYNYGRDYYTYVWPRDGALTILPLIDLGYFEEAKHFFDFCVDTMHPDGYMMHKYQPDRAIGSTWHPLMHQNHPELAIQEDETASVIYALTYYIEQSGDDELADKLYPRFIKPCADFMSRYIDEGTNLPHASYDLWEERFGTHAYTVLAVHAALERSADLADQIGQKTDAEAWRQTALRIKDGLVLFTNPESGVFRRSVNLDNDGNLTFDETPDSSTGYAMLMFGDKAVSKDQIKLTYESIINNLYNATPSGGVIRYTGDSYFLADGKYPGNPWHICNLWLAQYLIKADRLELADKVIDWTTSHASQSGTLSEQIAAEGERQVGVSPLVWSHAELVYTLMLLAKK